MQQTSLNASNKAYLILSLISFAISFFPRLEEYRLYLVIAAISLIILIYFSLYMGSVNNIEKRLAIDEEKIDNTQKVLNTLMNLITIKEIKKMNKKGQTADDVLEWIKIAIAVIIGFIIIKALLPALFT